MITILRDIIDERIRQEMIHPDTLPILMMFAVLVEEIGEIGTALQNDDKANLYEELVQAAASCVRMAERVKNDA